MESEFSGKS
jgi:hypothetical protein